MKTISFFVTGIPKGQPRPRAFTRNIGGKVTARMFDAGTAEAWKGDIARAASEHITAPMVGPLLLKLAFSMPRPKGHFKKSGAVKDTAPRFHTGKPDADNLAKAVMDALTALSAWQDDTQVVRLVVQKAYGTPSGCHVTIQELEQ